MIIDIKDLPDIRKKHPKIALCHGVFDVVHPGHDKYFEIAKELGETVVVSVTCDKHVNKGPGRPYFSENVRADHLNRFKIIDYVVISHHPTSIEVINLLKPNFYIKGPDYRDKTKDVTGGIYEEERAVKKNGGALFFTEDETHSSSALINRFFQTFSEEQAKIIDDVKSCGGMNAIQSIFDEMGKLKVAVIGEPIVDTYIFCQPEGISSKSPSISAKYLYEENYAGGSLAIANALAEFTGQTKLFLCRGKNETNILKKIDKRVLVRDHYFDGVKFPRKTRYIEHDKSQRVFELTEIQQDLWNVHSADNFIDQIFLEDKDLNILCDFGHGLFEGPVLACVNDLKEFTAINCQTNSSNFGFNPFTKHKKFDYLSLDLREARVAFHDRYSSNLTLFKRLSESTSSPISMTLGSQGSFYKGSGFIKCPAFSCKVVDATGAGDMYYAMTSLMVKLGAKEEFIPFVGNIFAGLYTKIIGNKESITKAQLFKAIQAILK